MLTNRITILIIEDETPIVRFLRATLENEGYQVLDAPSATEGLRSAAYQPPDVVILDLGLPDLDGKEVLKRLREWFNGPILILSARDQESEKIEALDLGADDYLTKPFGIGELLARLRTALRHMHGNRKEDLVLRNKELEIDLTARTVKLADQLIHLTPLEYKLLVLLMKNSGKVLTHRYLLKEVWGPGNSLENHYLRVFVANVRKKIRDESAHPRYILTEPGVGYRFISED